MGSAIKNRKEHTNYKHVIRLIICLFSLVFFTGLLFAGEPEKTWTVVIDAGHGGKDPGAIGSISREKNINLAVALKTGEYLEKNIKNIKVLYTRKTDVFVELNERADFANRNKADLFISIHTNWISKNTIKGTETWIMGPAKNDQNLEVAMKENEVILLEDDFSEKYEGFDPKSPESYIMFTVMQNIYSEQSMWLASHIQSQFRNRAGRNDRGVKQAGFWVLYMTAMPSVLVETGFITNQEEEKYLNTNEGQDYIASSIFRATRDYINDVSKKSQVRIAGSGDDYQPVNDSLKESVNTIDSSVVFMVQISTSVEKKVIKPDNFNGIKDVTELPSSDRYKYAAGKFSNYSDAVEYRKKLVTIFPDAFVIAIRNNKILPLQEALNFKQAKTK